MAKPNHCGDELKSPVKGDQVFNDRFRRILVTPITTKYSLTAAGSNEKTTHRDWSREQLYTTARYSGTKHQTEEVGDLFAFIFKNTAPRSAQIYEIVGILERPHVGKTSNFRSWWCQNLDRTNNVNKLERYESRNVLMLRPLDLWVKYESLAELAQFKPNWTMRGTERLKNPVDCVELFSNDDHHLKGRPDDLGLYDEMTQGSFVVRVKEPRLAQGWVYFIQEESKERIGPETPRRVKIGITRAGCEKRRRQLQTGNPRLLQVYRRIFTWDYQALEAHLHRAFTPQRVRGEWFMLSHQEVDSLVDFIKSGADLVRDDAKKDGNAKPSPKPSARPTKPTKPSPKKSPPTQGHPASRDPESFH